jgi:Cu(I)/Ag(I) efflux system membrane fusion protein
MKNLPIYIILLALSACNNIEKKEISAVRSSVLNGKMVQSVAFNQSFKKALNTYYNLKDQFIAESVPAIQLSANRLLKDMDSLLVKELKGDTTEINTAQSYIDGIAAEIKGLLGENSLEAKRKSLQMISEQFYDLIRTVQYDQDKIYHEYCPKAFNDDGATWLSNSMIIRNPYLPKTMLNCGEVLDSINFRIK